MRRSSISMTSHWLRGEFHPELLERALSVLEKHPPSAELARVCGVIGLPGRSAGGAPTKHPVARQSSCVRPKRSTGRMCGLGSSSSAVPLASCSAISAELEDARAALRLAMEAGVSRPTEIAYNNLADTTWKAGHVAESIDIYRKGIEFGERRGLVQPAEWSRSEMTRPSSRPGSGRRSSRSPIPSMSPTSRLQVNRSQGVLFGTIYRARVLALRGYEAEDLVTSFWPRAREVGDLQILAPALKRPAGSRSVGTDARPLETCSTSTNC